MSIQEITASDIYQAHERIEKYIHRTPVVTSNKLDELIKRRTYFKCENLQKTGSFKARGVLNAILLLKERNPNLKGVVAQSSGNHGQAVAWASNIADVKCCVVIPKTAPKTKATAIKYYGADVVQCEPDSKSCTEACERIAFEKGYEIVHTSNNYDVIAGQGTIAVELLQQAPSLDAIFVSASGGGMISGIALAVKDIKQEVKVFLVEPEGKMTEECLRTEKMLWADQISFLNTIADGLISPKLSTKTFPIICQHVEKDVFTVNDKDIVDGMKSVFLYLKMVIEASAGATVGAVLSDKLQSVDPNIKNIGIILCGGNVDLDRLPWCS